MGCEEGRREKEGNLGPGEGKGEIRLLQCLECTVSSSDRSDSKEEGAT